MIIRTRKTTNPLSPPRLAVFNHKGGVGKTTITVNVAAALAKRGKRVLLVDSDPQCNLTAYLVEEGVVNDLLDTSDSPNGKTLWSALKPVVEATGEPKVIPPIQIGENLLLLPGDIRLADFELELHTLWNDCFQRKTRGFRGTAALSWLVGEVAAANSIDFIFFDSGPNVGPLNRIILLDCDGFIIPAACDLFSLRAISTLGQTLVDWITDWKTIALLAPEETTLLPGSPKLIGFIPQRFRVYRGLPSAEYASFIPRLEKRIHDDIISLLKGVNPNLVLDNIPLQLGEVKDLGSLANSSQAEGVPVFEASSGTALQLEEAQSAFLKIADAILQRVKP